jgi:hypothetical protein
MIVSKGMSTPGIETQGANFALRWIKGPPCRNRPGIEAPREAILANAHELNRAAAEAFAANVLPIVRQIQAASVSGLQNIANALNDRGVRAARGGAWHNSTVRNLLARA